MKHAVEDLQVVPDLLLNDAVTIRMCQSASSVS